MSQKADVVEVEVKEKGVRIYEVGFHLVPVIAEEQVSGEFANVRALVENHKGAVISEEMPKLGDLAYEISKVVGGKKHNFNKAYFGWVKFEIDGAELPAIEAELKKNENVLRYLMIKTVRESTLAPAPKVAVAPKAEGEKEGEVKKEKVPVSEAELDKTIDQLLG